jgi:hypothetical protein
MANLNLKKKTKVNNLINNKEFIDLFDDRLYKYILASSENISEGHTALKRLYFMGITNFDEYECEFYENGYYKFYNKGRFVWPLEYRGYKKGSSFRGKKRDDHSKFMKVKMKGIDRGDSFREKKKNQNQSIEFKIKFLKNKDVIINYQDYELVKQSYCKYISDIRKSVDHKINKINNFILKKKYSGVDIYDNYIMDYENVVLTKENYHKPFTEMMSMISIINININENMGTTKFFKKGNINVKFCLGKNVITYRSGWELNTINFLEENKIPYEYEPFYIKKIDNTYYLPDFLLYLNGNKILLEIKGFINGEEGYKNEELKIDAGIKYCNENGYKYSYLNSKLTNLKQINENIKN